MRVVVTGSVAPWEILTKTCWLFYLDNVLFGISETQTQLLTEPSRILIDLETCIDFCLEAVILLLAVICHPGSFNEKQKITKRVQCLFIIKFLSLLSLI